ncbi:phytoene desaturase family protein [Methanobacterium sp. CWC-01]|uniref:phytoene desaturase family protein n=1 Tax=Methanobacterium aridiramus TaxID=2584467 RepID=UPI002575DB23|nr:NAD(P)/FAD-dependent oxidoreductase [Methanobacterium sp. CWC-01]
MSKSVIIIGAGIAGLAAGCYAQMNGFKTKIFEMHNKPGGLCTAWKRKDYTFDLSLHWITGSLPKSNVYPMWEELGLVQDRQYITHEYYNLVLDEQGNKFYSYTNPDKLQEEMLRIAPEDEKQIKNFVKDVKKFGAMDFPYNVGLLKFIKMFPSLRLWRKYSMSVKEMAAKFRNPTLRNLFELAFQWHDQTTAYSMMGMAQMGAGVSGYPLGGSYSIAKALEKRYVDLGGNIAYNSQVKSIIVEDNQAVGIELMVGTHKFGDIILSAADGHTTLFDWLNGQYTNSKITEIYQNLEIFPPLIFISLGVNHDYSQEPHYLFFPLKKPLMIAGKEIDRLEVRNHSFDHTLAPKGKTAFTVAVETNYDYWAELKEKPDEYSNEKKKIEEAIVNGLSELYPKIRDEIEVMDIATPLTFIRFTGNWKGSYQGWLFTKKSHAAQIPQTLHGLFNFYMAGQWVSPGGGLIGAATSAKHAVQMICKNEKQHFKTTKP